MTDYRYGGPARKPGWKLLQLEQQQQFENQLRELATCQSKPH